MKRVKEPYTMWLYCLFQLQIYKMFHIDNHFLNNSLFVMISIRKSIFIIIAFYIVL